MLTLTESLSSQMVFDLEQAEANYWKAYYQTNDLIKGYATTIAGGFACALPGLDILAMNRVIGLGRQEPLTTHSLKDVIDFYASAGSKRFFIQLPPQMVDESVVCLLEEHGFIHHNNWSKLYREAAPVKVHVNDLLTVKQITKKEAGLYGSLIFQSFDWEDERLPALLASTVGQPGYLHYIVYKDGRAVAAAALFVEGTLASMAFAGTLPEYRGLGAQSLLLQVRLTDAYEAGAKLITSETAQHTLGRPVKSFQNMCKHGFELAYQRQNWLYRF